MLTETIVAIGPTEVQDARNINLKEPTCNKDQATC
jgi:hypothetical protein